MELAIAQNTDQGRIPRGWTVRRLGDLGQALIGLTYAPSDVASDGILVLRSSNVHGGRLLLPSRISGNRAARQEPAFAFFVVKLSSNREGREADRGNGKAAKSSDL